MKKVTFILLFVLTGIIISFAQGPVSINTSDFTYSQNFNTLTTAGNWTNGSTLTGWYAKSDAGVPAAFYLNDGSLTTTSPPLASFGTVSDNDRALGFVPVGSNNDLQAIGLRMENNSGSTLTSFTISWDGEQWRNSSVVSQDIKLYYKTSTSDITVLPVSAIGWTSVNQFDSPQNLSDGQPAVALNGNDAANRGTLTATISVSVADGSEIMFVWFDTHNAFSFDHLFAIDNVSVTSTTQQSQTITFPEFEDVEYGNVSFSPGASASSGLPVTYSSSNISVASVSGSNLVINGVGSTVITASQAGGSGYLPAASVQRTLNVYPQIPVMGAATSVTGSSFVATWTIDNGATDANVNYLLYVDDNASFSSPVTYSSSGKSYNVTGLSPGVVYNFRVIAKSGLLYSENYSNSQSVLIGNDVIISTPGNWSELIGNNTIANKITIAASVVVDTDPDIDELVISSNGALNVVAGKTLKINNRLIINSDASNNSGKVLNRGVVNINSAAQIVIRKTFVTGKWNFVGFPFNVSNVYNAGTTNPVSWGLDNYATADIYVKRYNGSFRAVNGQTAGEFEYFTPFIFTANRGYILWSYNNATYDFVITASERGAFFNSTASYGLSAFSAASPVNANWNLVSNPFASTFNLKESSQGPYYLYNSTTGGYDVAMSGANVDLVPYRPFFVQRTDPTLLFSDSGRKLMPASVDNSAPEFDEISLTIENSEYEDLTRIRLKDGASNAYVIGSDAVKMLSSFANVPQFFSRTNNISYAVNTLPYNTKEVELFVKIGVPGEYTVKLSDIAALNNTQVTLVDKVTGDKVDMLTQNEYQFTSYAKGTFDRFKVILSQKTPDISTGLYVDKAGIRVLRDNGKVAFEGLNSLAEINEFDLSGRKLNSYANINNGEYIALKSKSLSVLQIITNDQNIKIKITNK
ncbi:MAG: fibronectin type III domain-containing protein [Paludibacteraceae bacterium]|nr:fibronectin type III domain-containing protein [Paludibacteraceae bacterium]